MTSLLDLSPDSPKLGKYYSKKLSGELVIWGNLVETFPIARRVKVMFGDKHHSEFDFYEIYNWLAEGIIIHEDNIEETNEED